MRSTVSELRQNFVTVERYGEVKQGAWEQRADRERQDAGQLTCTGVTRARGKLMRSSAVCHQVISASAAGGRRNASIQTRPNSPGHGK